MGITKKTETLSEPSNPQTSEKIALRLMSASGKRGFALKCLVRRNFDHFLPNPERTDVDQQKEDGLAEQPRMRLRML